MINPHPGLPEFDYIKPKSLSEACQFLADHADEARPLCGGTDTFVRMRDGFWKDKYLVDIKGLDGTEEISFDTGTGLTLGAAVSMNRTARFPVVKALYPVLAAAVNTVASYQLRTRATVVGNICNASPAGDTIGACLLLDGVLQIHGVSGFREEALANFFLGPGETTLEPGEIVISIQFPLPPDGLVGTYVKHGRNKASDLAIVGVTAVGCPDPGMTSGFRIRAALASAAPVPLEVTRVEEILGKEPITETALEEAALAAMQASSPIDDVRGGAEYRKYMVRNLTRQALTEVWEGLR